MRGTNLGIGGQSPVNGENNNPSNIAGKSVNRKNSVISVLSP